MSVNRFFVSRSSIDGGQVRLSPEQAHQVCHVLRLKTGDAILVLDDSGIEYDVTLTAVGLPETVGQVVERRPARGEPAVQLVLFQSLLSREKFEWVLQKGTEVGVARFVPILTERSIVRAKMIEEGKLDRWRKIVTEAAEQAHRGRIPRIESTVAFREAVSQLDRFDRVLIATPTGRTRTLKEVLMSEDRPLSSVAVLIGPEGGFSENEVEQACANGAIPVGLGRRILRTETAATVLPALVLYELGDLQS